MARDWAKDRDNNVAELKVTPKVTPKAADEVAADINNEREDIPDDEVVFRPTPEQRKCKAKFYAVAKAKKLNMDNVDVDIVDQNAPGFRPLRNWWHNSLFVEWFTNTSSHQSRIDYLINLQLDNLEEVIINNEGLYTPRDQVAAGRQLAEYKKAFIDEEKAERPNETVDMVRQIALKMLETKKLAAARKVDESEIIEAEFDRKVDLPT